MSGSETLIPFGISRDQQIADDEMQRKLLSVMVPHAIASVATNASPDYSLPGAARIHTTHWCC